MIKLFTIALVLFSGSAFASKARLTSLGQDSNGSHYIKDNRNVFLNPAYINSAKPGLAGEWGATTSNPNVVPRAEGGIILKSDSMSWGLQLGRLTNINEQISSIGLFQPQNNIDVIFGKDMGDMSTGFGIHYAGSAEEDNAGLDNEAKALALSAGFQKASKQGYARIDLVHESENNTTGEKYDGDLEFELGGTLHLDENSLAYAEFEWTKFEYTAGAKTEFDNKSASLGYVKFIDLNREGLSLFVDGGIRWSEDKQKSTGTTLDSSVFSLPIVLGVEAPVKEWLDLRASVAQTVILDKQEDDSAGTAIKNDNIHTTTVTAGASLKFADFVLDGVFKGSTNNTGDFDGNNFFSQASLTYNF